MSFLQLKTFVKACKEQGEFLRHDKIALNNKENN